MIVSSRRKCSIVMDATELGIDPNASYSFEIMSEGKLFRWTGARPEVVDGVATFDWRDGKNGVLVGGDPELMRALQ